MVCVCVCARAHSFCVSLLSVCKLCVSVCSLLCLSVCDKPYFSELLHIAEMQGTDRELPFTPLQFLLLLTSLRLHRFLYHEFECVCVHTYTCVLMCMCSSESEQPFKSFKGPHSAPEGILLNIEDNLGRLERKMPKPTKTDGKSSPSLRPSPPP